MADSTENESITEIVPKVLGQYLIGEIQDYRDYYAEFPQASRDFRTPSVSIILADSDFRPLTPYPCLPIDPANIVDNKAEMKWAVGIYDFSIQLDIWARNKEERDDLFDATFNALNPDITPMGLRLVMEEYFDQLIEYVYTGHDLGGSEQRSESDEWRVTMTLLATCKAVRTRTEFIITDVPSPAAIESQTGTIDGVEEKSEINPNVLVIKV